MRDIKELDKIRVGFRNLVYIGDCGCCCDSSKSNCVNCENEALSDLLTEIEKHYVLKKEQ